MRLDVVKKINSFIRWFREKLTKKQFLLFSSVLVGISAGLSAIVLKTFVHLIYMLTTTFPDYKYVFVLLPVLGILLTVLVIKRFLAGRLDKGLSHIHYAIAQRSSVLPKEQMYAQVITSSLTVGMGGSAGLEAPIVITGAAVGSNYSKTHRLDYKERTLLLACGVAAGIGAAFNAPIAGVLFALEVMLFDVSITAFTPLIIAAASGALVSKIFLQDDILFSFQLQMPFDYHNVPFYILLGVLAGLISVYHSRIFSKTEAMFSHSPKKIYLNVVLGGLALCALLFVFPSLFGEGYRSIKILSLQQPELLLDNSILSPYRDNAWLVLLFVGLIMLLKAVATGITLGSGGNGGNFAPSMFVGAYLGFFLARLVNLLDFTKLPESNFCIVGMAGILSGLYHAPLTSIFLIAEITGGYTLMIPLMIVSSISFAISKYFEPYSMDTKQLAHSGQIFTSDKDKNILTTIKTSRLVETDFQSIYPEATLGELVQVISSSKRNIFPVTDEKNHLLGIILLDNIRDIMFKTDLYDRILVKELMIPAPSTISSGETMDNVMKKFDETGAWNLPVIDNGSYIGFISKSKVFSSYRSKLMDATIE